MKVKNKILLVGRILLLGFFLAVVIIPIYWMFVTSLKTQADAISLDIQYWPKNPTLMNYRAVLMETQFVAFLKNSLIVAVVSGFLVLLVAIPGGYALSRYNYKGKSATMIGFLVTQMIPGTLLLVPLFIVFANIRLQDTLWSLIIYYTALQVPFCTITMQGFFINIPVVIEEAAKIDGCTLRQTIMKIVLPVMLPGIIAVFIFAFVSGWNDLLGGIMFINSETKRTIPVGLSYYVGQYSIKWGEMTAGGMMALIPSAILFAVAQKYIVEGMTSGAVKG
ncbi:MAG: carbohydrate ABC transporter permease [Lachnospiraceae bacterium]|nr:carbohydrate ABC transporter permease [Lachnospiraceae bacterium]